MAPDVRVTPGTVCKGFYARLTHPSASVSWRWRWGWQWRCAGFVVRTTGPAAQGWVFEPPLAPVGWSSFQRLVDCCGWSLMRWELQLSCCLAVRPDICPCSCRKVKKKGQGADEPFWFSSWHTPSKINPKCCLLNLLSLCPRKMCKS